MSQGVGAVWENNALLSKSATIFSRWLCIRAFIFNTLFQVN